MVGQICEDLVFVCRSFQTRKGGGGGRDLLRGDHKTRENQGHQDRPGQREEEENI